MLVKCYGEKCLNDGVKHEKNDLIVEGGKRYCNECLKEKHKKEAEMSSLYRTIKRIYRINFPTGMMLRQIKTFKDVHGYTYAGMEDALLLVERKGVQFKTSWGINIISYYYEEAKSNRRQQEKAAENNKGKFFDNTAIVIKAEAPNEKNAIKQENMVNIEDLI